MATVPGPVDGLGEFAPAFKIPDAGAVGLAMTVWTEKAARNIGAVDAMAHTLSVLDLNCSRLPWSAGR